MVNKLFNIILAILPILLSLWFSIDTNFLYCMDNDHENLLTLKNDLEYWQSDLEGLKKLYNDRGFNILTPNELSQEKTLEKLNLEDNIRDGERNVRSTIKEIIKMKSKISNNNTQFNNIELGSNSSLGKRANNDNIQWHSNKK